MAKKPDTATRIADNKKAAYNYFFEERFEAGLVLKAGRSNHCAKARCN
jgi:SsrA-binding protein